MHSGFGSLHHERCQTDRSTIKIGRSSCAPFVHSRKWFGMTEYLFNWRRRTPHQDLSINYLWQRHVPKRRIHLPRPHPSNPRHGASRHTAERMGLSSSRRISTRLRKVWACARGQDRASGGTTERTCMHHIAGAEHGDISDRRSASSTRWGAHVEVAVAVVANLRVEEK